MFDSLQALVVKAKAWYDSKTAIDKLTYTVAIAAIAYAGLLFFG